ncbi:MAG: XRE family transcriptional regulator [Erythrobacter sp.]|nr:XRE family transcriptional regulator [Erythrobacter sp.]
MPTWAQLEYSKVEQENRRSARRVLQLRAQAALPGGGIANVTIHNGSTSGLLIETALPLEVGDELQVEMPEAGEVTAMVTWNSGRLFGCRFEREISQAALSAAQLRSDTLLPRGDADRPANWAGSGAGLGRKIERLRKARGMTLADVAAALEVSKPTVWAWEKGKARPIGERIPGLAEVLQVDPSELTGAEALTGLTDILADARRTIAAACGVAPNKVRIMLDL